MLTVCCVALPPATATDLLVFLCRAALPRISQNTLLSLRFCDLAKCSMPLSCVGKLITVRSPKYTRVHKSFSEKCERWRRANICPTILGHVDGREELTQFQRSQRGYVIFNVSRSGLQAKENVRELSDLENPCLSKNFCFFPPYCKIRFITDRLHGFVGIFTVKNSSQIV